jgi:pyruvate dehydrogenase E1 component beta subunit
VRVAENLNQALHSVLGKDSSVYLLGEDIADPYGGAFKITKGLSGRFPAQVLPTPLSEGGILGVANGLALAGEKAIVEMMFGDFAALGFDQIVNFAAKSVSMYGRRVPMPVVIRCPSGGNRGYGPTHSQTLQKHFLGVPGLSLFEMSPFHDNTELLERMLGLSEPCMLFEDKVLYTRQMYDTDELFEYDYIGDAARVFVDERIDCVFIAPGGLTHRVLSAIRGLLIEDEISGCLLVPSRLYPFDVEPLLPLLRSAGLICLVEEGTAGGTWGSEVAAQLQKLLWGSLRRPIALVSSAPQVIPTAAHLERQVLVQDSTIRSTVREAWRG